MRLRPHLPVSLIASLVVALLSCGGRSGLDTNIPSSGDGGGESSALDATAHPDGQPVDGALLDASPSADGNPQDGALHDGAAPDGPVLIPPDGGADGPTSCGPTTCATCCQPDGTCAPQVTDQSCGAHGAACAVCPSGFHCDKNPYCIRDAPGCSPSNCDGCCWINGGNSYCLSGFSGGLCGHHGEACQACDSASGLQCTPDPTGVGGSCQGNPPPCSPTTCNGCCYGPICATGTQDIACGTGGLACTDCTAESRTCRGGACGG